MKTKAHHYLRSTALLILLVFSVSCTGKTSSYGEMCNIYARIVNKSIPLSEKEGQIAEGIRDFFPDFFNKNFVYIMKVNADGRYAALKESIELDLKQVWECDIARHYYENEFNKSDLE